MLPASGVVRVALVVAGLVTCSAGAAEPQAGSAPRAEAKRRFDAGAADYEAGRYADALREFSDGYAIFPNPKFLLNMGQAQRKLGRLAEARASLAKYAATLTPGDPRRADVDRIIAELDRELPPATSSSSSSTVSASAPASSAPASPPETARDSDGRRRLRFIGIGLGATAAAAVIIGGALVGVARNDDHLLANWPNGRVYDPAVARERDSFYPAGLTMLAVGGALLVGGTVAIVYSLKHPPAQKSWSIAPWFRSSAGVAGLALPAW